jgi:hypothetical protein
MSICDERGKPITTIDPISLCWSDGGVPGYLPLLSRSDYEYVDLIGFDWKHDFTFHIISKNNPRTYERANFLRGNYYITIAAYADDAAAHTKIYQVILGETEVQKQHDQVDKLHYFELKPVRRAPQNR